MNRAAAALLCVSLLHADKAPPLPSDTVSLRVTVQGIDPAETEMMLRIIDLSDGSETEETLSGVKNTFMIAKGREYLAALKNCPPGYMPSEELLITSVQSEDDLEMTFELHPFEVRIFQYCEDTEESAPGGVLQLRDESDEEVIAFVPDEEGRIIDEEGEEFLFESGASYVLAQKESATGYERGCEQLLLIPEFMGKSDDPLVFEYRLQKQTSDNPQNNSEPLPFYEFIRPAQPYYGETDPFIEESPEEEPQSEAADHAVTNMSVSDVTSFQIPEVYLSRPERKESGKIENPIERTGFIVRLVDEKGTYISGASVAVMDENGNTVDSWRSIEEDHLVEGPSIRADETYTVHLVKPAPGFSGSIVDTAHTVRQKTGGSLPVIELCDTRIQKQTAAQKTQTVKKTVNYALYACVAAAVLICGVIGGVCLYGKKRQ